MVNEWIVTHGHALTNIDKVRNFIHDAYIFALTTCLVNYPTFSMPLHYLKLQDIFSMPYQKDHKKDVRWASNRVVFAQEYDTGICIDVN